LSKAANRFRVARLPSFLQSGSKLIERRQCIAGVLQEQHRDLNVKQMFGALLPMGGWPDVARRR
jgi:hypothetical protein